MNTFRRHPLLSALVLLVVLPIGFHRVRSALRSTEESVRDRVEYLLDALEERQPKRIVRSLAADYVDETAHYSRDDVVAAARSVLMPGTRYRAELDAEDGIVFRQVADDAVTVRVRCAIDTRVGRDGEWIPWWNLEFTADMERRGGDWMVLRTRDVNHEKRPR